MKTLIPFFIIIGFAFYDCNHDKKKNTTIPEQEEAPAGNEIININDSAGHQLRKPVRSVNFKTAISALESKFMYPTAYGDWYETYSSGLSTREPNEIFITRSKDEVWKGINDKGEIIDIVFEEVTVTEVVLRLNEKSKNSFRPSLKIYEFDFGNDKLALRNQLKLEQISKYILSTEGLKNPNWLWQYGTSYYLFQTRAAVYESHCQIITGNFKREIAK